MKKREKIRVWNTKRPAAIALWVIMAVFLAASIAAIVYQVARGEVFFANRGFFLPVLIAIPWLLAGLGIRPGYRLYCAAYVFMLFAFTYGNLLGGFKGSEVTDKVSHFLSGLLFTQLGYCFYYKLAARRLDGSIGDMRREWGVASLFAAGFASLIALAWEVFEFIDFNTTGNDSQNHLTTGVFDTMQDLIAALIASALCVAAFALWRFAKVKLLTAAVVEEFYTANCPPKRIEITPEDGEKPE